MGRLYVPNTSSLHNKSIVVSNITFARCYTVAINDKFEMCYYEISSKSTSRVNLFVKEFILQNKGCIIKHECVHYEALITNELRVSSAQWPRSVSFNRWLTSSNKNYTCPMRNKSNDDSFIQCNLCNSWIHEICVTNMHYPFSFKEKKQ